MPGSTLGKPLIICLRGHRVETERVKARYMTETYRATRLNRGFLEPKCARYLYSTLVRDRHSSLPGTL
jgi:hypothetical protein